MRFLAALLLFAAAPLSAQEATWEPVHSIDRVHSFTELNTGTLLAGVNHGLVLRSTDGGETWEPISSGASFSLAAFPDGAALAAGPSGVYRSADDGNTWTQVRPNPGNSDFCNLSSWWSLVIALPDGAAFAGAYTSAGFQNRSSDSGCEFRGASQQSPSGLDDWTLGGLAVVPVASATTSDGIVWIAGDYRVSHSTDGGSTWLTPSQTPSTPNGYLVRALHATEEGLLFAGTGSPIRPSGNCCMPVGTSDSRGLFHSTDGETWTIVEDLATREVLALTADDIGRIYAGTDAGVFRSTDGGTTWAAMNTGLPPGSFVTALRLTSDGYLIAGVEEHGLYRLTARVMTDDEDTSGLPSTLSLHAAYPNPFASSTTLTFDLPVPSRVTLTIFDVLGREAAVVLDEHRFAGTHDITWAPTGLPSGVYVARLETDGEVRTRRLILTR